MKKKSLYLLVIIAAALLLLMLGSTKANAATTLDGKYEFRYLYDEGEIASSYIIPEEEIYGIMIDKYLGEEDRDIVIPDKIEGYDVKTLGYDVFKNHTELASIQVPASVENIMYGAFDDCYGLKLRVYYKSYAYIYILEEMVENDELEYELVNPDDVFEYSYVTQVDDNGIPTKTSRTDSEHAIGIRIDSCLIDDEDVIAIPREINGLSVLSIYHYAFNSSFEGVEIPGTVVQILENAVDYGTTLKVYTYSYGLRYAITNGYRYSVVDQWAVTDISNPEADITINVNTTDKTYTGEEIYTDVALSIWFGALEEDMDYVVNYNNNINVGTATVTITGIGSYKGTVTRTFKIVPKDIVSLSVNDISIDTSNKDYTGNEIKITVTVKDGEKVLKAGTDYNVSYKNNVNPGNATVIVEGKGNYKGKIERTFTIVKKEEPVVINLSAIKLSSVTNVVTKSAKITWKKDSNVDGYEVYMAEVKKDSKNMKTKSELTLRKSTSTKSKALMNIPKGALVQIIKKNIKKSGGYTWYKVKYNGKTGYVASKYLKDYYKTGSYKKIKTISKNSTTTHTQKKLTKNKKYSFKVKSYKKVDNKTYYSAFSNAKEVTIKK